MSNITNKCKRILKEAKLLNEKSYLWFPDGQLIPRAKGTLILENKVKK